MADTKLYRSFHGRVIGGVASGLADFFGMDPTIVRLIFVLLAVFGGGGVLLYIILWIVLPEKNAYNTYNAFSTPSSSPPPSTAFESGSGVSGIGETFDGFENKERGYTPDSGQVAKRKFEGSLIGGLVLILIGVFFLAEKFIPNINFGDFWPLILVVVGLVLIFNSLPGRNKNSEEKDDVQ